MKNVATESAAAVAAAAAAGSEVAVVVLAAASGLVKSIMGDVRVRVWKQNNSIRGMSKLKCCRIGCVNRAYGRDFNAPFIQYLVIFIVPSTKLTQAMYSHREGAL